VNKAFFFSFSLFFFFFFQSLCVRLFVVCLRAYIIYCSICAVIWRRTLWKQRENTRRDSFIDRSRTIRLSQFTPVASFFLAFFSSFFFFLFFFLSPIVQLSLISGLLLSLSLSLPPSSPPPPLSRPEVERVQDWRKMTTLESEAVFLVTIQLYCQVLIQLIARGMFCGAKYTHHTFTPLLFISLWCTGVHLKAPQAYNTFSLRAALTGELNPFTAKVSLQNDK